MAKKGAFWLLFLLLDHPAEQFLPRGRRPARNWRLGHFPRTRSMGATAHIAACFFRKSVAHNGLAGLFLLSKFAVIRQFRAESVIEISWLRFRDSIALSMCF